MALKRTVFITGVTGHIGNSLARSLQRETGWQVGGMATHSNPRNDALFRSLGIEPHYGDICDGELLRRLFRGIDVVVHCAARIDIHGDQSNEVERVNVEGPRVVAEAVAAAGVGQLIHFSSIHARNYDSETRLVNEETPLALKHSISYNRTKATAEKYMLSQTAVDNVTVLAPTGVIGPNDYRGSEMGEVIVKIALRKQPFLVRGGFDWVDVRDVCAAVHTVIKNPRKREGYLLNGHFVLLQDVAATIAAVQDQRITTTALPLWMARLAVPFAALHSNITGRTPKFTRDSITHIADGNNRISHRKARNHLGYSARPFVDTIADTLEWFRGQGVFE